MRYFFRLERVYIERKESGQVMSMNQDIHNFIQYLHQEKQTSEIQKYLMSET